MVLPPLALVIRISIERKHIIPTESDFIQSHSLIARSRNPVANPRRSA